MRRILALGAAVTVAATLVAACGGAKPTAADLQRGHSYWQSLSRDEQSQLAERCRSQFPSSFTASNIRDDIDNFLSLHPGQKIADGCRERGSYESGRVAPAAP